jgi:hypothetical protein
VVLLFPPLLRPPLQAHPRRPPLFFLPAVLHSLPQPRRLSPVCLFAPHSHLGRSPGRCLVCLFSKEQRRRHRLPLEARISDRQLGCPRMVDISSPNCPHCRRLVGCSPRSQPPFRSSSFTASLLSSGQ